MKEEAKDVLIRIARLIEKDNDVYEVYEQNGHPLKRFWYKSEKQFTWGAGFFIYAYKIIHGLDF